MSSIFFTSCILSVLSIGLFFFNRCWFSLQSLWFYRFILLCLVLKNVFNSLECRHVNKNFRFRFLLVSVSFGVLFYLSMLFKIPFDFNCSFKIFMILREKKKTHLYRSFSSVLCIDCVLFERYKILRYIFLRQVDPIYTKKLNNPFLYDNTPMTRITKCIFFRLCEFLFSTTHK